MEMLGHVTSVRCGEHACEFAHVHGVATSRTIEDAYGTPAHQVSAHALASGLRCMPSSPGPDQRWGVTNRCAVRPSRRTVSAMPRSSLACADTAVSRVQRLGQRSWAEGRACTAAATWRSSLPSAAATPPKLRTWSPACTPVQACLPCQYHRQARHRHRQPRHQFVLPTRAARERRPRLPGCRAPRCPRLQKASQEALHLPVALHGRLPAQAWLAVGPPPGHLFQRCCFAPCAARAAPPGSYAAPL